MEREIRKAESGDYEIEFICRRMNVDSPGPNGQERLVTICKLWYMGKGSDFGRLGFKHGGAILNPDDMDIPAIGERLAFKRAIKKVPVAHRAKLREIYKEMSKGDEIAKSRDYWQQCAMRLLGECCELGDSIAEMEDKDNLISVMKQNYAELQKERDILSKRVSLLESERGALFAEIGILKGNLDVTLDALDRAKGESLACATSQSYTELQKERDYLEECVTKVGEVNSALVEQNVELYVEIERLKQERDMLKGRFFALDADLERIQGDRDVTIEQNKELQARLEKCGRLRYEEDKVRKEEIAQLQSLVSELTFKVVHWQVEAQSNFSFWQAAMDIAERLDGELVQANAQFIDDETDWRLEYEILENQYYDIEEELLRVSDGSYGGYYE